MSELRISYEPDDEWTGRVSVRVATGQFSGLTSAWVGRTVIDEFANSLSRYPIPREHPSCMEAAYGGTADGRLPPETLIKVCVKPVGVRGELLVMAELRTEIWDSEDADLRQSINARFITGYALLERFARSLAGVASGHIKDAVLEGKPET